MHRDDEAQPRFPVLPDDDLLVVVVGGTIPADDAPELKKLGVAEVFTPGASTDEIVEFIRGAIGERRTLSAQAS